MPHITHFVLILSLCVGLVAVTVSAQMYRRFRMDYLHAHLAIIICFNLMIFINMVALYIIHLPEGSVPDAATAAVADGHSILVPLLQLLAAYYFMRIVWGMLEKKTAPKMRQIALVIVAAIAVLQAAAVVLRMEIAGYRVARIISSAVWLSVVVFICAVLLSTFRDVGRVAAPGKRSALRAYWLLLLCLLAAVIVLIVLQYSGILAVPNYNFVTGFLIVVMNALPILYLGWFAKKFHGSAADKRVPVPDTSATFEAYGISPREKEIIRLICEGKTNREIAEELFISIQTVKDHAYRIFRKTGVKNRVQLANLFSKSTDARPPEKA